MLSYRFPEYWGRFPGRQANAWLRRMKCFGKYLKA
jgi:hypothetical protein